MKIELTEKEEERLYKVMNSDNAWDDIQPCVEKMLSKRQKKAEKKLRKQGMYFQAKLWDLTVEKERYQGLARKWELRVREVEIRTWHDLHNQVCDQGLVCSAHQPPKMGDNS